MSKKHRRNRSAGSRTGASPEKPWNSLKAAVCAALLTQSLQCSAGSAAQRQARVSLPQQKFRQIGGLLPERLEPLGEVGAQLFKRLVQPRLHGRRALRERAAAATLAGERGIDGLTELAHIERQAAAGEQ